MRISLFFIFTVLTCLNAAQLHQVPPFTIASMSLKGSRPEQQDTYYVAGPTTWERYAAIARKVIGLPLKAQPPHDGYLAGIFDGHGDEGKKAAHIVRNLMTHYFTQEKREENEEIPDFITRVFQSVDEDIKKNHAEWAKESGSTALIFYFDRLTKMLYTAWCGDSRAVWGTSDNESTVDHSLYNHSERNRVNTAYWNLGDDSRYLKNSKEMTIAVTRGLGDLAFAEVNFIAIPEITCITLEEYPFILGGCDGMFDFTDNKSLHDINAQNNISPLEKMKQLFTYVIWKDDLKIRATQYKNTHFLKELDITYSTAHTEVLKRIKNPTHSTIIVNIIRNYSNILHDNTTGISIQYDPEAKPLEYNIQRIRIYCVVVLLFFGIGTSYTYFNF